MLYAFRILLAPILFLGLLLPIGAGSRDPRSSLLEGRPGPTVHLMPDEYTLTINFAGAGRGLVSLYPPGPSYADGTVVTLTPAASLGSSFGGWSGPDADALTDNLDGSWSLIMDQDRELTGAFTLEEYTLMVTVVGTGTVQRNPDQATYHYGDEVTLKAQAAAGWTFAGWDGDASGAENPETLTITGNTGVVAIFTQDEYTITAGTVGAGSVQWEPEQATYHYGDAVTLTAYPTAGWIFAGWSGDASGTQSPKTITIAGNTSITATFIRDPHRVVYLPLLPHVWPPRPGTPTLLGITNSDGDGDYAVRWSTASGAETYTLQEATKSSFAGAKTVYAGPLTLFTVTGRGAARYYYRVRAHNGWGDSDWSNAAWVDVRWEAEPNDNPLTQANGPIVSGLTYYGTFPSGHDVQDYFYFDLPTPHRAELSLTNIPVDNNYDLVLRDADLQEIDYSRAYGNVDEHIRTRVLPEGRYYVQVHNYSQTGSTQRYHLRAVYE
jgi:uncharacterized repeat protein (TIGR02543 family)